MYHKKDTYETHRLSATYIVQTMAFFKSNAIFFSSLINLILAVLILGYSKGFYN